ncbi:MAG: hypothetical protein KTR32_06260, partial [Granulosicoccus sp.]|nr:hypothetical protein [Granulosicoccus sp.]
CSDDAADAVENSEVGNEAEQMSQEARAEAESEAANEGTGGAGEGGETGGAGGASESGGADRAAADDALDGLMAEGAESEDQKKARGRNFLEILADAMGQTQAKFLNEAMKHSKTMESLAGDSERADEFTIAQSKYTAAMQMFNIYSNQVSTTLKTMGEAFSAIARKQ